MSDRLRVFVIVAAALLATESPEALAQTESPTRISAEAFGDYYWVAVHDDEEIEGRNGFWLRRINVTFDRVLGESLTARLRLEASQPGDFTSGANLDPIVKDAWVKWRRSPAFEVVAGIAPTPTWTSLEEF